MPLQVIDNKTGKALTLKDLLDANNDDPNVKAISAGLNPSEAINPQDKETVRKIWDEVKEKITALSISMNHI